MTRVLLMKHQNIRKIGTQLLPLLKSQSTSIDLIILETFQCWFGLYNLIDDPVTQMKHEMNEMIFHMRRQNRNFFGTSKKTTWTVKDCIREFERFGLVSIVT